MCDVHKFKLKKNVKNIGSKADKVETFDMPDLEVGVDMRQVEPNLMVGYISLKTGLYSIDFFCPNCGKYYEDIIFHTRVKCECGAVINLTLTRERAEQ